MDVHASYREEITRLRSLEQNNRLDVGLRMVGIPLGSVLYFLYTDDLIGFWWSGGYVACYVAYRCYLNALVTKDRYVGQMQQVAAHLFVGLLTVTYIWLPSIMLVDPDMNLSLVGAALIGSQLVHLVHRGDTSKFLIVVVTVCVFVTLVVLIAEVVLQTKNAVAIAGIVLSWVALIFYLYQSLLAARARILAEAEAKEQVYQSQKMSALGQLAGGVAHDFNNILTAISGNLQLYHALNDADEKNEVLRAAEQSSERAAGIVRQILVYARKSPLEIQLTDANDALASLARLVEPLVPANIDLELVNARDPVLIKIDIDQMATALMNLVLNSVDAMPDGGRVVVSVLFETSKSKSGLVGGLTLSSGPFVVYRVADAGPGIPRSILESVTDPFFTTKPVGKGTGLGLSMAVSIAQNVGGGLELTTSSSGTTVQIYVPMTTR
ncbi:MAG: ATP-binding protein [Pseudomonadota bacterium]